MATAPLDHHGAVPAQEEGRNQLARQLAARRAQRMGLPLHLSGHVVARGHDIRHVLGRHEVLPPGLLDEHLFEYGGGR